jgi:hypothetical protein
MSGAVEFVPGRLGQAFHFNGGQFLTSTSNSSFCPDCRETWSVSFFAKFDSTAGGVALLNRDDTDPDRASHFTLGITPDHHIVANGRGQDQTIVSGMSVMPGHWYHVAMVTNKMARSVYVDGLLQGESPMTEKVALAQGDENRHNTFIGANQGKQHFFKGAIDELAVFNRALSPAELRTMASACKAKQ